MIAAMGACGSNSECDPYPSEGTPCSTAGDICTLLQSSVACGADHLWHCTDQSCPADMAVPPDALQPSPDISSYCPSQGNAPCTMVGAYCNIEQTEFTCGCDHEFHESKCPGCPLTDGGLSGDGGCAAAYGDGWCAGYCCVAECMGAQDLVACTVPNVLCVFSGEILRCESDGLWHSMLPVPSCP
jgi:hypothetical protein